MIKHSEIYTAIKDLFDDDSDLSEYVDRTTGNTKVVSGSAMPKLISFPAIQVLILTDNFINTSIELSDIVFNVNILTRCNMSGEIDDEAEDIIQKVNDLINNQPVTITDGLQYVMFVESRIPAFAYYESKDIFVEGLRCRMIAA